MLVFDCQDLVLFHNVDSFKTVIFDRERGKAEQYGTAVQTIQCFLDC